MKELARQKITDSLAAPIPLMTQRNILLPRGQPREYLKTSRLISGRGNKIVGIEILDASRHVSVRKLFPVKVDAAAPDISGR